MGSRRLDRISEEIKKVVSNVIRNDLKDPRISTITSITDVELTKDLRYAKIYVSILGNELDKEQTLKALNRAKGFIRREIGNKVKIRYTPEPLFYLDESIERGVYINQLIKKIQSEKEDRGNENE
ncbi:30S ribosome-binding factor RbfA [Caldisalinibacter kiritimatiensis]|uniref:Ribosome-binding factor A n=1 Tax=Caldisalinibacter kiritimatiensis TaxID=1304284 RepID=R1CVF2_9FIRM|nr:30S ribosome-binding factor RbfA [Caldisalinibacter kiritimatiensis]EOD00624.1 Ribosome-binding factor A [Caldisalinibacter kiritimatiensis]